MNDFQELKDALRGRVGQGCQFDDALIGLSKGKSLDQKGTLDGVAALVGDLRALAHDLEQLSKKMSWRLNGPDNRDFIGRPGAYAKARLEWMEGQENDAG